MMNWIRCKLGLHVWRYEPNFTRRECFHCGLKQFNATWYGPGKDDHWMNRED